MMINDCLKVFASRNERTLDCFEGMTAFHLIKVDIRCVYTFDIRHVSRFKVRCLRCAIIFNETSLVLNPDR